MHTEEVGESIFILMAMEPKTTVHDFHSRWTTDAYLTVFRFCFFLSFRGRALFSSYGFIDGSVRNRVEWLYSELRSVCGKSCALV